MLTQAKQNLYQSFRCIVKSIRCKLGAAAGAAAVVVKLFLLSDYLVDLDIQQHVSAMTQEETGRQKKISGTRRSLTIRRHTKKDHSNLSWPRKSYFPSVFFRLSLSSLSVIQFTLFT